MSQSTRDSDPDSSPVTEESKAPAPRRWIPQNGRARQVFKWTAISGIIISLAGVVVAIKTLWPYRPVLAVEMVAHAKADMAERSELEARTDKKIQSCLDAIRHLREDRNTELKRQNEMLRKALSNMGGSP